MSLAHRVDLVGACFHLDFMLSSKTSPEMSALHEKQHYLQLRTTLGDIEHLLDDWDFKVHARACARVLKGAPHPKE